VIGVTRDPTDIPTLHRDDPVTTIAITIRAHHRDQHDHRTLQP